MTAGQESGAASAMLAHEPGQAGSHEPGQAGSGLGVQGKRGARCAGKVMQS